MYVCICQGVTQTEIELAIEAGKDNVFDISEHLGAGTGCGSCQTDVEAIIHKVKYPQTQSDVGVQVFEPTLVR